MQRQCRKITFQVARVYLLVMKISIRIFLASTQWPTTSIAGKHLINDPPHKYIYRMFHNYWDKMIRNYSRTTKNGVMKIMFIERFISYILVDASGWVVSDVSFGFMGGFGSCNIRSPHPNDPVGIDLTPTPIPAANLRIHTRRKK